MIVGAFVIGAVFTPPDVLSQLMLAIPLWLLYELGIFLARFVSVPGDGRRRRRGGGEVARGAAEPAEQDAARRLQRDRARRERLASDALPDFAARIARPPEAFALTDRTNARARSAPCAICHVLFPAAAACRRSRPPRRRCRRARRAPSRSTRAAAPRCARAAAARSRVDLPPISTHDVELLHARALGGAAAAACRGSRRPSVRRERQRLARLPASPASGSMPSQPRVTSPSRRSARTRCARATRGSRTRCRASRPTASRSCC